MEPDDNGENEVGGCEKGVSNMTHKKNYGVITTILLLMMLPGSTGWAEVSPGTVIINMESWAPYYRPFEAKIEIPSHITWNNPTASPHTVRHDGCVNKGPCLFDSGAVLPNGSFTIQALPPGRYPYHCELHPIMRGELVVEGKPLGPKEDFQHVARIKK